MTIRQRILKSMYPFFLKLNRGTKVMSLGLNNSENKQPKIPFYSLKAYDIKGNEVSFEQYKGKKVMIVNVASDCGYTGQYDAIQKLYAEHQKDLVVLGFPANNFKGQEPGTDSDIEQFCSTNYHITFPLFHKTSVLKPDQDPVFNWLSDKDKNGWNSKQPTWNFSKYLVNEKGVLTNYFAPAVTPDDATLLEAIKA